MSGEPSSFATLSHTALVAGRVLAALFCSGLAVRLMDDALDAPYDRLARRVTLGLRLGEARLPYALVALALGAAVDVEVAFAAFAAAYALGMGSALTRVMPSGLPGWAESLIALALALLVAGPRTAAVLILVMVTVQACDDVIDAHTESPLAAESWVHTFGWGGTGLLGLGGLAAAAALSPLPTVATLCAVPLVESVSAHWAAQLRPVETSSGDARKEVAATDDYPSEPKVIRGGGRDVDE